MLESSKLRNFVSDFIDANSDELRDEINQYIYNNPETNYKVCYFQVL